MTALVVTGQIEPVTPLSVRSWFMRAGEGDLDALKVIADAFVVPPWVLPGGGTIGSKRASLTDDQVECCIRDAIWRLTYYTGSADAGYPTNFRSLDLYNWIVANAAMHAGLGPTIDCGNIAALYTGLVAAYGIPSRRIWSHTGIDGSVDTTNEYWSPTYGWVHVVCSYNAQAQWVSSGRPASNLDCMTVAAQFGVLDGVIHHVPQGASTGASLKSGVVTLSDHYIDYSTWGRGNRSQFVGGAPGDPNFLDNRNLSSFTIRAVPESATAYPARVTSANGIAVAARDISDVTFTPSALMVSTRVTDSGMVAVALDAIMLDPGFTYQVKAPAGAWTNLLQPSHMLYPVAGQAWQYRALGPLGNTSNVVTVTVA